MASEARPAMGLRVTLQMSYEEALEKVVAALSEQGFGVLTEVDVKATMKEKLDADFRKYIILGTCNPPLAHRAISAEAEIGLLLPCNVLVYEDEHSDDIIVSIVDPMMMVQMVDNAELHNVAQEARARFDKVVEALS